MDPSGKRGRPLAALLEVLALFAAAHLAFRAFRTFTEIGRVEVGAGLVLSPGLIFAATALAAIAWRGGGRERFGLTLAGWRSGASLALATVLVLALGGFVAMQAGIELRPRELGALDGVLVSAGIVLATLGILWALRRGLPLERLPGAASAGLVALLVLVPLLWNPGEAAVILGLVLCAGFGEELFFRGYVQSRLDGVLGRPWSLFGVPFGAGLIAAAALFGLVHVLNPCDYFGGACSLAWWHGLVTFSMPYGFLRARTGSVLAPALVHGLVNLLGRMPELMGV